MNFRLSLLAAIFLWLLPASAIAEILADPISTSKEINGARQTLIYKNSCRVPVTIKLQMTLTNVAVEGPRDLIEVPALGTVRGPTFRALNPALAWNFKTTYRYNFGRYSVSSAVEPFRLPWAKGQSHVAGQAFGGERSHSGDDRYAVDFPMSEGTPVHAARQGLVVYMREHYSEGGWRPDLRDKDNHIMIAHADGTISRYLHLRHNGSLVELGQWVEAGQLIGYSGNVGLSSGPHLHFDVIRPGKDLITQTIPFQLLRDGVPTTPSEGMRFSD